MHNDTDLSVEFIQKLTFQYVKHELKVAQASFKLSDMIPVM